MAKYKITFTDPGFGPFAEPADIFLMLNNLLETKKTTHSKELSEAILNDLVTASVIEFYSLKVVEVQDDLRIALFTLLEALRPFAAQVVSAEGGCHVGLTTMENCCRCAPILKARAAIKAAEKDLLK